MKKKISVIIAAYNEERHIADCLNSLINQTVKPDEIIVVDDGSTDKTWRILLQLKQQHPSLNVYRKQHVEQATARNFGFTKSKGDILIFPDADYYFDPRFIEKLVAPIVKNQTLATFSKEEYIANPDNVWSKYWDINRYMLPGQRIATNTPNQGNMFRAITRSAFIKSGGYSETGYPSDLTVMAKLGLPHGASVAQGAICYHFNPDTLSKVFQSAFRLGNKGGVDVRLKNFLIYSLINSLRKGLTQVLKGEPAYVIFKIVFDLGVTAGLMVRLIAIVTNIDSYAQKTSH